ncbi:MAG: hypothetical protein INQ03_16245 [Candidatus Heimdallarchaeota archaeon]|nr:hypothetical protein [Candidatus Heimdallarchaeota archaeon]
MSGFFKKAAKGAADLAGDTMKVAFTALLGEIVAEIVKETGIKDMAQEKLMSTGFKVIKDLGMDTKNIQRDLIKAALKKELGY